MSAVDGAAHKIDIAAEVDEEIHRIRVDDPHRKSVFGLARERVAQRHGMNVDAVTKSHQRNRLQMKDKGEFIVHARNRFGSFTVTVITTFVLLLASRNMPISRAMLATTMEQCVPGAMPPPGLDAEGLRKHHVAVKSFVKRLVRQMHKDEILSTGKPKPLFKSRSAEAELVFSDCARFATHFGSFVKNMGQPPDWAIINWDETRLVYQSGKLRQERIFAYGQERHQMKDLNDDVTGSLISLVAASGDRYLDAICIKGKKDEQGFIVLDGIVLPSLEARFRDRRGTVPLFYCFSESGYFSREQTTAIIEKFTELWKEKVGAIENDERKPARVLAHLFSDNLASHKDQTMLLKQLAQNVVMWSLPANTSHFTQPCDAEAFACFKSGMRQIANSMVFDALITGTELKCFVIRAAHEALAYLTPAVVKKSFLTTRLFPFDEKAFLEHARANLDQLELDSKAPALLKVASGVIDMFNAAHTSAQTRVEQREKNSTTLKGKIRSSDIVSAVQLAEHISEQTTLREYEGDVAAVMKEQKELDRKFNSQHKTATAVCRSRNCGKKYKKNAVGWFACDCNAFRFCADHKNASKATQMWVQHKVTDCPKPYTIDALKRARAEQAAQLASPICAKCGGAADGSQPEVQCMTCALWLHAQCAGVVDLQSLVGNAPFWCSVECANKQNVAAPPLYLPSGDQLPSRTVLDIPAPPPTDKHATYSKYKMRRASKIAKDALAMVDKPAKTPKQVKRAHPSSADADDRATPAKEPVGVDVGVKVGPGAPRLLDDDEFVVEDDVANEDLPEFVDDDDDQVDKNDDDAPPVPVARSLNAQLAAIAAGAKLAQRSARAKRRRFGESDDEVSIDGIHQ